MAAPDWPGLLKWSTQYHDGTRPATDFRTMSKEVRVTTKRTDHSRRPQGSLTCRLGRLGLQDRDFLEEALKSVTIDEHHIMKQRLQVLAADIGTPGEQLDKELAEILAEGKVTLLAKEDCVEELSELLENVDHANDLPKIGGIPVLLNLLQSTEHPSLAAGAASCFASISQNNPTGQACTLQSGCMPLLLGYITDTSCDARVRVKSVQALSALVRGCAPAQDQFIKEDGLQRLVVALEGAVAQAPQDSRFVKKIVFFLQSLLLERKLFRVASARTKLVQLCTALIAGEDVEVAEISGKVLQAIAHEPEGMAQAQEAGTLEAVKRVQERVEMLAGEEKELMESCSQRLASLRLVLEGK
eukprot:scaffold3068_cov401-Prasinococcus_capsulatus_cf.AAC.60